MSNEAQKARAARLQELIDKRVNGNSDPPSSPREFTDRAANEARREAQKSTSPQKVTDTSIQVTEPIPHEISEDNWLNRPENAWFKRGYEYACTQNQEISTLCQGNPEALFHVVTLILRGAIFPTPEVKKEEPTS